MQPTAIKKNVSTSTVPPVVREYEIGGIKYTVSATTKDGATENAATKVRRMIRKEINNLAVK